MIRQLVILICLMAACCPIIAQQPAYTERHLVVQDDPGQFIRVIPKGDGLMRTYLVIDGDLWDLDDERTTYIRGGKRILVCIEGYFKKGQRDGVYTAYVMDSINRKIRYKIWEQTYSGNQLNGEWRVFSLSGTLVSTQTFLNDSLYGLAKTFWVDGKTVVEERQYLSGKSNYILRAYSRNGTVSEETTFKNDLATGAAKKYYPDGVLMDEVYLLNGIPNRIRKYYYPSGKLWIEQELKNGNPWTVLGNYTEQGQKRSAGTLKEGNGTVILYNDDGSIRETVVYRNGVASGTQ